MAKHIIEKIPVRLNFLGEGPHWDGKKNELFYVDIFDKSVHRYAHSTGEYYSVRVDNVDSLTFVIPVEGSANKYIIGCGREILEMEWNGYSTRPENLIKLGEVDEEFPNNRFNDAKCDPEGRIWAGTMGYETIPGVEIERKKGSLYKLDLDGDISKHEKDIDISNGLAWDNNLMYFIDSLTKRVDVFDFSKDQGTISNRRTAFDYVANSVNGIPDGMTIDSNKNLWVATFGGSKVLNIDPNVGKVINEIKFPTLNVTSVAFGGPNLDSLFVSSSQHGHKTSETDRFTGALFKVVNLNVKGLDAGVNYKGLPSKINFK